MKRILLTGATGFIGTYVARQFLAEGNPLRVLVRNPDRLHPGIARGAEVRIGDVRDPGAVDAAMKDIHTVLHLAAFARAWSRDPGESEDVNVYAVAAILDSARRRGVARVVHTSSILALPPYRAAGINGRCSAPTPYERTKQAADLLVQQYVGDGGDAVIVRPTRVYGPGPLNDANGVTKMLSLYLAGRFRMLLNDQDVQANYVFVADVADGILRAAGRGRCGQAYLLGGENASLRDLLQLASRIADLPRRTVRVPVAVGLAVGRAAELWGKLGGTPSLTPEWIRIFLEDRRADISASRAELGYAPRSLVSGLRTTLDWIATEGVRS
jgi:farnesol dehydrogenase